MSNNDLICNTDNSVLDQDKSIIFSNYPLFWINQIKKKLTDSKYQIYINKPNFSFQGLYLDKYKVEDIGDKVNIRFEYQINFIINSQSGFYTKPENICNIVSDFKLKISDIDENASVRFSVFNLHQKDGDYYGEMVIKLIVSFLN